MKICIFLLLLVAPVFACDDVSELQRYTESPLRPDPALTPGEIMTSDTTLTCMSGYAKKARKVSQRTKERVYLSYHLPHHKTGEYQIDHLIPPSLGGANTRKNLWPQSYETKILNAHVKDALEWKLHRLVCAGKVSLLNAQVDIARDWTQAYEKYIGPLPGLHHGPQP